MACILFNIIILVIHNAVTIIFQLQNWQIVLLDAIITFPHVCPTTVGKTYICPTAIEMAYYINPYHLRLLRALAIYVYHGRYPISGHPGAKSIYEQAKAALDKSTRKEFSKDIHSFQTYLDSKITGHDIGTSTQQRLDIIFGEKPGTRARIREEYKHCLIKVFNTICCLKDAKINIPESRFPLYNDWVDFEKTEQVPLEISTDLGKPENFKAYGYYTEGTSKEKEIAKKIESAVKDRVNVIFNNLNNKSQPESEKKGSNKTTQRASMRKEAPGAGTFFGQFVCFRSSTNGRFIHIYPITISKDNTVSIKKLKSYKDKLNKYKSSTHFMEKGICISLSEDRYLIQVYKDHLPSETGLRQEILSLSIFEIDKKKMEYRGFRLGYDWKTQAPKLSVTRFYLVSIEEIENRLAGDPGYNKRLKNTFFDKLPFDIKVNSKAYKTIPFHPEMRFLPMRLGGVFDNAMTFYDGGNNDDLSLPDFAMLRIFFNAAKGAIAKPKIELSKDDYKLAAEYLTKSIEHGLTGHIKNITEYNKIHKKDKHKETNNYSDEILQRLFNDIINGVDKLTKHKIESWKDEFLELRRRYDETKNYSKSSDINIPLKKRETNYLYRVANEGGKEDDILTKILNKIFDYKSANNK